jgi:hypothetical protein
MIAVSGEKFPVFPGAHSPDVVLPVREPVRLTLPIGVTVLVKLPRFVTLPVGAVVSDNTKTASLADKLPAYPTPSERGSGYGPTRLTSQ